MTLSMVVEHLSMVVFAIVIAILIGVPLGLLCYLSRAARGVVLRVVDLIQTTPALALLGIIMVTPLGAGKPTVILGLALYSLLPIVRNVTLGLSQVSPAVKEAAKGMGMTRVYSLFHVELPLAMPMLFTGLRIAVVNAIGTAVFASSVGGGGLGNLINTGIRRNDVAMILSGTAALMAMALLLDNLMAFCERRMGRRDSSRRPGRHAILRRRLTAGAAAVLVAALCLPSLLPKDTSSTLVLYDGEFSEVQLVNRMVQQLVEDRTGLEVNILDPMTSINNFKELTAREPSCDLMYTWDGTILTTFLGLDTSDIPAGQSLYDFVNGRIGEQYGARMLGKIGVDNTYSIGVTQQVMDTYHPETISDLVPIAGELRFGAEQDFYTDAGSMKYGPFVAFYGLQFQEAIQVDIMLKYTAIKSGSYDVMVVYATDGLNKDANLTILEDDKSFFPEYNGVLTVRDGLFEDFADRAPELEQTLELLTGQFTNEVMSELTYRVDVLGEDVDLKKIALATAGTVGADLANLVNEAALRAVRLGRRLVTQEDLLASFEFVIAGSEKKNSVLTEFEKKLVAYHEVGHAMVAYRQKHAEPVSKITIVPHTQGALGYTLHLPEEDKHLHTRDELLAQITVSMGGRVAEELVLHTMTNGAAQDIQDATGIARNMVAMFGMSDEFGMMALASRRSQYLDGGYGIDCAQDTAAAMDRAVRDLIDACYKKAVEILSHSREDMDKVVEYLLEKETITGAEMVAILEGRDPALADNFPDPDGKGTVGPPAEPVSDPIPLSGGEPQPPNGGGMEFGPEGKPKE